MKGRQVAEKTFAYNASWHGTHYASKKVRASFHGKTYSHHCSHCLLLYDLMEVFEMKIAYDPSVDALYIEFCAGTVVTQQINDDIALDFDEEGHIAGIEILAAKEHLSTESLFSIYFEPLMDGVLAEAV